MLRNCLVCNKKFKTIPAKVKVGKGKFCSKACYLVDHSKNTWSVGVCLGCGKEFRYQTYRRQTCCSLGCNMKWRIKRDDLDKRVIKKCRYCTKEILVRPSRLKTNRGEFCCKKCYSLWLSKNQTGEKCPSWKGGITPLYRRIRTLAKYYKWRREILKRDEYQCKECGEKDTTRLIVDHIVGMAVIVEKYKITNSIEANGCKELWDTNNGRTLCKTCHVQTKNYGINGWVN